MDLSPWPGLELVEPLPGGVRNRVLLARRGSQHLVVRRSGRSRETLDWELDLLEFLSERGIGVPRTVPADDGRRHADGLLVQMYVNGRAPTERDWPAVVTALRRVHELTVGWPQRPGFASSRALLTLPQGGDVDLDAMPMHAVELVRSAWRRLDDELDCVVHGDAGGNNILVERGRIVLLDWDESRVDLPAFDFAHLPIDRDAALITAGIAWEAATCWVVEPEYARGRLAELERRP